MKVRSQRSAVSRERAVGLMLLALALTLILASCASLKPYDTIRASTDRGVIDALKNRAGTIKSINAELDLIPSTLKAPSLGAYMSYSREGLFRLAGLTPNGFPLFDFKSHDDKFTLSLSNRLEISGDLSEFRDGFKTLTGTELPVEPDTVKETIDFYGVRTDDDTSFYIEELPDSYIINQLKHDEDMSYPLRRWWLDKGDKRILRKEVFSKNPAKRGEILMEAEYGDFRVIDDILTPFTITIKEKKGKKLLKMKFSKVEYTM